MFKILIKVPIFLFKIENFYLHPTTGKKSAKVSNYYSFKISLHNYGIKTQVLSFSISGQGFQAGSMYRKKHDFFMLLTLAMKRLQIQIDFVFPIYILVIIQFPFELIFKMIIKNL